MKDQNFINLSLDFADKSRSCHIRHYFAAMRDFSIHSISGFYYFTECGGLDVFSDGNLCSLATGAIVIDERRSLNRQSFPKNKRRRDAPLFTFAVIILPTQKTQQTQKLE